jgi:hypothetical protein
MATQQMKIDLTAKDKTGNAFRSLNARLEKTRKIAKSVVGVVAKVGAAAVALGAGFVVATKKALEFADSIAKTADKVGLSTDALQKYRYAADLAGVSNGELDKAFDKLNKSIGETISDGTGAAFDAFEQLGLSSDLMSGKLRGTEPVFLAVSDALAQVDDHSQRAALAADIFGRSGTKLINLMKNGRGDIKAAAKELDDFGGVIEEGTLRSSEKAIDAITRLTTLMQSKLTKALADNAELIADFGGKLLQNLPILIEKMYRFAEAIGLVSKRITLDTAFANLQDLQTQIDSALQGLQNAKGKVQTQIAENILKELRVEKEAALKIYKDILDASASGGPSKPTVPFKPSKPPARGGGLGLSPADRKKADEAAAALAKREEETRAALERISGIQKEILKGAQDTAAAAGFELEYANASESVKNRALAVAQIENRLKAEGITLSDVQREQLEAALDLTQQRQQTLALIKLDEQARIAAAEKLKETQRQANELIKTGLQSMQDGLTGLIDGTQTWKQALGGVLRTVINIAAKMGETSTGGFSFGKLVSGLGSLFGGGSVIGGQPIPVSGPNIMHTGGKIAGPNGRMAGLRSDERMIIGQTGERVLSRGQTAQGDSGGVVINQTINLSTGVQQTVRAEVMSLAPQIAAQAKAAVLDAKKRGGGFGAAFA